MIGLFKATIEGRRSGALFYFSNFLIFATNFLDLDLTRIAD